MARTHRRRRWLPFHKGYADAQQGLQDAERELARVRRQWPLVRELSAIARAHMERNHISETLAHIYRGGTR